MTHPVESKEHDMSKHEMQINMHDIKVIIQRRYYLTYSKLWIITSNFFSWKLKSGRHEEILDCELSW